MASPDPDTTKALQKEGPDFEREELDFEPRVDMRLASPEPQPLTGPFAKQGWPREDDEPGRRPYADTVLPE
jgi:hypothetical protein